MNTPLTRTTREMKISNGVLVTDTLKALGSATKGELALHTGLSIATCGAVLNELSLTGEVLALELEASRGGRPAQRYACNPDFFSQLSIYAAGSDTGAELVWSLSSATGERLAEGEQAFKPLNLATLYGLVDALLTRYPDVSALGLGLPGVMRNGVVATCDISLFAGLPIAHLLQERTGRYTLIDNDMNFTAWGFYRSSCADETAPIAYIYKPDVPCTGCGMVINGRVLSGASNFAGEVSHLPFNVEGELPLSGELARIIVSLTALINPATVAIAGHRLAADQLPEIVNICQRYVPHQHLPTLIYREEIRDDYLRGIAELTLQHYNFHRRYPRIDAAPASTQPG